MNTIDFQGSGMLDADANGKRQSQFTKIGYPLWRSRENGGYQFMPITLGGVQLWNPLIRISGRKTLTETPLVELGGTVKEIIGLDDYIITIRGVIKTTDGLWPDAEFAQLAELYSRMEAVSIESGITSHLLNGIEYVVITSLNLPENQGHVESVRYELECVSDKKFELNLEA